MNFNELREYIKSLPTSQIIQNYISLEKKGQNYMALCPWHNDHTPSLSVTDTKGLYKCWTCDIGGDAINFVEKYLNTSFKEALSDIGQKLGIAVEEIGKNKNTNPKYEMAYRVLQKAAQLYRKLALSGHYLEFNDFLSKRNLTPETAQQFCLGFSPKNSALASYLTSIPNEKDRAFALEIAKELQLVRTNESGILFDTFRERIIFPIWNSWEKVVGFTTRATKDYQKAKYMNSTESFIFHKKDILYALHMAKPTIRLKKRVFLVEGQMDCITLHQYGFQESVAISGTALSENLIQNIKTLTDQVYFLLDNDQAGQKAMSRLNAIMLKEGLNPKRVDLTPHKDPDEFLIKEGQLALNERIENAITVLDFTLEQLVGDKIPSSTDQKLKKLNEVFAQLKPLGDNLMASEKVIFWAKRLGLQSSPNEIAKAYQDFLQLSPNSNPLPVKDSSSEFTSTRSGNHLQNSEITESDDEIDQIENESPADLGPISVLSESAQAIAWESERSIWKTEKKLLQNLVQNPTLFECEELGEVLDFIEHSEVKQFIRTIQEYFFEIEESEFPKMVKGLLSNDQCSIEIKEIIGSGLFNYLPQKMDDKIRDKMFTDFKKGLHYDHLKEERNRLKVLQKQAISDEQSFEVLSQIGKIEREMNQLKK